MKDPSSRILLRRYPTPSRIAACRVSTENRGAGRARGTGFVVSIVLLYRNQFLRGRLDINSRCGHHAAWTGYLYVFDDRGGPDHSDLRSWKRVRCRANEIRER